MLRGLWMVAVAGTAALAPAQEEPEPLNERERAAHVLSRLGYGARPGEIDRVIEMGVDAWLEEQLRPEGEVGARLESALSDFETLDLTIAECVEYIYVSPGADDTPEERRRARELRRTPMNELMESLAFRAALSDRQLEEVLCDFWRNHFNVSFTKGQSIYAQINDYDRTVLRGNLWGSFPDMLRASARHPAMLNYLDNYLSRRPPSKQELARIERNTRRRTGSRERGEEAAQIASQRGLNENYARELLELHTLGVDNYYDQEDVIAVAQALTGWTFEGGREGSNEFKYRPAMHVEGRKRVLGRVIRDRDQEGYGEGLQILELLGEHKGTADFIATKLVRHFVNDRPPEDLVEEVADTYRREDGSIPAMMRTIVESEEFWSRENYRAKFKTPFEYVISALRATDAKVEDLSALDRYLRDMGQRIYHCDDPTGYYDVAEAWLDPGVMALRWQFAIDLAEGNIRGVRVPDSLWEHVPEGVPARLWQHHLTRLILPGGAGERTRAALATVTTEYLEKNRVPDLYELGPQLVGLLLGSPEFQKQ